MPQTPLELGSHTEGLDTAERVCAYVIDDEPVVQSTLSTILKREKYQVTTFDSAEDFRAKAPSSETPHLLIVDKNLPGMSGLDLVSRQQQEGFNFEAILITGFADLDSALRAMRLGLSSYLTKPFELSQLLAEVQRATRRLSQRHRKEKKSGKERASYQVLEKLQTPLSYTGIQLESLWQALEEFEEVPYLIMDNLKLASTSIRSIEKLVQEHILLQALERDPELSRRRPIDLVPLLRSLVSQLSSFAHQEQKTLVIEEMPDVRVKADPALLAYGLKSLLYRAISESEPFRMIYLDLERPGQQVAIHAVVQETGNIVPIHRFRDDQDALQLCRRIFRAHGGDLSIRPFPGGTGLDYVVSLPVI